MEWQIVKGSSNVRVTQDEYGVVSIEALDTGEVEILIDQPSKTFQRPQKDPLCFPAQLLPQEGIILPVLLPLLHGQY